MEGSAWRWGSGVEPGRTNLAVAPSPVATTTVPAKLDVPMPVPQRVIPRLRSNRLEPSPMRTKDGCDVFWMASRGEWANHGTGVSSTSFWDVGESFNWTSLLPPLSMGSDGRADEHIDDQYRRWSRKA